MYRCSRWGILMPKPIVLNGLDDLGRLRKILIQERLNQGLSQRQLAAKMGHSQAHVSQLESGVTINPGLTTWLQWAAGLGLRAVITLKGARNAKKEAAEEH